MKTKSDEINKVYTNFREAVADTESLLRLENLRTLQVNLGDRCNQRCNHCHVQAGPEGKKVMSKEIMGKIIRFLKAHRGLCVDITGGCPELNPDFRFFVESVYGYASPLMVRTNFTVFFELGMEWLPVWYCDHKVVVIGSLPCYTRENVDKQRGPDVFEKSIRAIQILNELGYGIDCELELNLVYNPGGDFLPGPEEQLQADYRKELKEKYGIRFNRLFTITNAPVGRFRQYLMSNGLLERYKQLLRRSFNHSAVENIMCRTLVSVDYKGAVYNCDFNQVLSLPIVDAQGNVVTIERLEDILPARPEIITDDHCFCCTAGSGSSCTGSLLKTKRTF